MVHLSSCFADPFADHLYRGTVSPRQADRIYDGSVRKGAGHGNRSEIPKRNAGFTAYDDCRGTGCLYAPEGPGRENRCIVSFVKGIGSVDIQFLRRIKDERDKPLVGYTWNLCFCPDDPTGKRKFWGLLVCVGMAVLLCGGSCDPQDKKA